MRTAFVIGFVVMFAVMSALRQHETEQEVERLSDQIAKMTFQIEDALYENMVLKAELIR